MATRSRLSNLSGESDRSSGRFPALPTSSVSASMDAPIPRRPHTGTLVPSVSDPALADPGTASLLSRHHSLNRLDKLVKAIQAVDRAQPHPSALPSRRTKKKRLGMVRSSVGNKATFPVSEFRPLQQFLLRDGGGKSNFPYDMAREDAPSTLHSTSMEWNVSSRPTLSAPLPSQFPYTSSEMLESRLKSSSQTLRSHDHQNSSLLRPAVDVLQPSSLFSLGESSRPLSKQDQDQMLKRSLSPPRRPIGVRSSSPKRPSDYDTYGMRDEIDISEDESLYIHGHADGNSFRSPGKEDLDLQIIPKWMYEQQKRCLRRRRQRAEQLRRLRASGRVGAVLQEDLDELERIEAGREQPRHEDSCPQELSSQGQSFKGSQLKRSSSMKRRSSSAISKRKSSPSRSLSPTLLSSIPTSSVVEPLLQVCKVSSQVGSEYPAKKRALFALDPRPDDLIYSSIGHLQRNTASNASEGQRVRTSKSAKTGDSHFENVSLKKDGKHGSRSRSSREHSSSMHPSPWSQEEISVLYPEKGDALISDSSSTGVHPIKNAKESIRSVSFSNSTSTVEEDSSPLDSVSDASGRVLAFDDDQASSSQENASFCSEGKIPEQNSQLLERAGKNHSLIEKSSFEDFSKKFVDDDEPSRSVSPIFDSFNGSRRRSMVRELNRHENSLSSNLRRHSSTEFSSSSSIGAKSSTSSRVSSSSASSSRRTSLFLVGQSQSSSRKQSTAFSDDSKLTRISQKTRRDEHDDIDNGEPLIRLSRKGSPIQSRPSISFGTSSPIDTENSPLSLSGGWSKASMESSFVLTSSKVSPPDSKVSVRSRQNSSPTHPSINSKSTVLSPPTSINYEDEDIRTLHTASISLSAAKFVGTVSGEAKVDQKKLGSDTQFLLHANSEVLGSRSLKRDRSDLRSSLSHSTIVSEVYISPGEDIDHSSLSSLEEEKSTDYYGSMDSLSRDIPLDSSVSKGVNNSKIFSSFDSDRKTTDTYQLPDMENALDSISSHKLMFDEMGASPNGIVDDRLSNPSKRRVETDITKLQSYSSPPGDVAHHSSVLSDLPDVRRFVPRCVINVVEHEMNKGENIVAGSRLEREGVLMLVDVSGFTKMAETLCSRGPQGMETLSRVINSYFSHLINIVTECCGDVCYFVGDALVVFFDSQAMDEKRLIDMKVHFRDKSSAMTLAVCAATHCSVRLQLEAGRFRCLDITLSMHIGYASGSFATVLLGGISGSYNYVCAGSSFSMLYKAVNLSHNGDITLCNMSKRYLLGEEIEKSGYQPVLKKLVDPRTSINANIDFLHEFSVRDIEGPLLDDGGSSVSETDVSEWIWKLAYEGDMAMLTPMDEIRPSFAHFTRLAPKVQLQLPSFLNTYTRRILVEERSKVIAELRQVTVCFINFTDSPEISMRMVERGGKSEFQKAICKLHEVANALDGIVSNVFGDEKGVGSILVFGLSVKSQQEAFKRGVLAAAQISDSLRDIGFDAAIGVTSGQAYTGLVGSGSRCDFTLLGDVVNTGARLMGQVRKLMKPVKKAKALIRKEHLPMLAHASVCQSSLVQPRLGRSPYEIDVEPLFLPVKGKSEPVECYRIRLVPSGEDLRVRKGSTVGGRPEVPYLMDVSSFGIEGYKPVFVGRKDELDFMNAILEEIVDIGLNQASITAVSTLKFLKTSLSSMSLKSSLTLISPVPSAVGTSSALSLGSPDGMDSTRILFLAGTTGMGITSLVHHWLKSCSKIVLPVADLEDNVSDSNNPLNRSSASSGSFRRKKSLPSSSSYSPEQQSSFPIVMCASDSLQVGDSFSTWNSAIDHLMYLAQDSTSRKRSSSFCASRPTTTQAVLKKMGLRPWAYLLNPILGTSFPDTCPLKNVTQRELKVRQFELSMLFLERLVWIAYGSTFGFAVFFFDNAHMMDENSRRLLRYFFRPRSSKLSYFTDVKDHRRIPFYFIFSHTLEYSTDVDVDIGGVLMDSLSLTRSQIEEIGIRALRLGQLQANEIRRFLAKSVGASEVSDVVVDEVFRNSRGDPSRLNLITRLLSSAKILSVENGLCQFSRTSFSSLLHSSQELDRLLEREFDFLSPAEKDIIRIASIIGEHIELNLIDFVRRMIEFENKKSASDPLLIDGDNMKGDQSLSASSSTSRRSHSLDALLGLGYASPSSDSSLTRGPSAFEPCSEETKRILDQVLSTGILVEGCRSEHKDPDVNMYEFAHITSSMVLYHQMMPSRRNLLHRIATEWYRSQLSVVRQLCWNVERELYGLEEDHREESLKIASAIPSPRTPGLAASHFGRSQYFMSMRIAPTLRSPNVGEEGGKSSPLSFLRSNSSGSDLPISSKVRSSHFLTPSMGVESITVDSESESSDDEDLVQSHTVSEVVGSADSSEEALIDNDTGPELKTSESFFSVPTKSVGADDADLSAENSLSTRESFVVQRRQREKKISDTQARLRVLRSRRDRMCADMSRHLFESLFSVADTMEEEERSENAPRLWKEVTQALARMEETASQLIEGENFKDVVSILESCISLVEKYRIESDYLVAESMLLRYLERLSYALFEIGHDICYMESVTRRGMEEWNKLMSKLLEVYRYSTQQDNMTISMGHLYDARDQSMISQSLSSFLSSPGDLRVSPSCSSASPATSSSLEKVVSSTGERGTVVIPLDFLRYDLLSSLIQVLSKCSIVLSNREVCLVSRSRIEEVSRMIQEADTILERCPGHRGRSIDLLRLKMLHALRRGDITLAHNLLEVVEASLTDVQSVAQLREEYPHSIHPVLVLFLCGSLIRAFELDSEGCFTYFKRAREMVAQFSHDVSLAFFYAFSGFILWCLEEAFLLQQLAGDGYSFTMERELLAWRLFCRFHIHLSEFDLIQLRLESAEASSDSFTEANSIVSETLSPSNENLIRPIENRQIALEMLLEDLSRLSPEVTPTSLALFPLIDGLIKEGWYTKAISFCQRVLDVRSLTPERGNGKKQTDSFWKSSFRNMTVENFSAELSENGKKTRSRDGSDDDDSDENDHEDSKLSSLNDSIPTGLTGSDSAGDFVLFDFLPSWIFRRQKALAHAFRCALYVSHNPQPGTQVDEPVRGKKKTSSVKRESPLSGEEFVQSRNLLTENLEDRNLPPSERLQSSLVAAFYLCQFYRRRCQLQARAEKFKNQPMLLYAVSDAIQSLEQCRLSKIALDESVKSIPIDIQQEYTELCAESPNALLSTESREQIFDRWSRFSEFLASYFAHARWFPI